MSMSEEVANVTMQIAEKAVTTAVQTTSMIIEQIARLLHEMMAMQRDSARMRGSGGMSEKARGTDLTELKPGRTEIRDLIASAKKTGDTLSVSENGLTEDDVKAISKKAKKYGIPIAFTNTSGKDNIYANVRTSDLPIFKQICTECIKEKVAERPQTMGNFKCQAWEIPFITAELNAHDLSAQFVQTSNGDHVCLYEKSDSKAIRIARDEFVKKCTELNNDLSFQKDDNGFFVIQDKQSGKEISFDQIPDKDTLRKQIQSTFGYDEKKAELACAKFGEEMLTGKEKQTLLNGSVQSKFSEVVANIELESDSILTKPYSCWQVTAKEDQKQRIVFRNNDTGDFAVLEPDKMTRKEMRAVLTEQLGITDKKELDALVDKAERVHAHYLGTKNELYHQTTKFKQTDFVLTDPEAASGMRRVDESGNVFVKKQPLDEISNSIERTGQNSFQVRTDSVVTEFDEQGNSSSEVHKGQIELSLSNKKKSIEQLTDFYKKQGVPEAAAKQMAKEVFKKASMQSIEKVVQIEEVKESTITVAVNGEKTEIPAPDREQAVEAIERECGVPKETAEQVIAKADEIKADAAEPIEENTDTLTATEETDMTRTEGSEINPELGGNGHEMHPEGNILNGDSTKPELPTVPTSDAELPKAPELPTAPELPPPPAMGGRR